MFASGAIALGGPTIVELALGATTAVGADLSAGIVAAAAAASAAVHGYRVRASST